MKFFLYSTGAKTVPFRARLKRRLSIILYKYLGFQAEVTVGILLGVVIGLSFLALGVNITEAAEVKVIDVSRFNVEMKITPESRTRQKTSLNGEWDFYPVKGVTEYEAPKGIPGDVNWEKIMVPSDWKSTTLGYNQTGRADWWHVDRNREYPARWARCPAAWYKREIMVPQDMLGKKVALDFDGVYHYGWIYVNGKFVGEHEGGTIPFQMDITDFVKYGEKNLIYVYVIDVSVSADKALKKTNYYQAEYDRPIFFKQPFSGIWQDVRLVSMPEIYTEDVRIVTSFRKKDIKIYANLRNKTSRDETLEVRVSVLDMKEKAVLNIFEGKVDIGKSAGIEKEFRSKWEDPKLWSPESPNLYYLKVELFKNNKLIDERYERFGFREFWCEGRNFMLNGKKIYLWGSLTGKSRIQFQHRPEAYRKIIRLWKSMGINNVRETSITGGNAPQYFFDVADEEGIMVIPMIEVAHYPLSILEQTKKIIAGRVKAHINHPSVIMWQTEGESYYGGKAYEQSRSNIRELTKVIMETDPTRPATGSASGDYNGMLPVMNWHYPGQNKAWGMQINLPVQWLDINMNKSDYGSAGQNIKTTAKNEKKPILLGETFYMGKWVEQGPGIERWFGDYITYMRYDLWAERYYEMYTSIPKVGRSYGISMMILGCGKDEYRAPVVKIKEYKLDWGDYSKPYIKPKYMWPYLNPGYLPDKPEAIEDKRFDILDDIGAPLAVSIWRDWAHNFISGSNIEKGIWVFNHTMDDKKALKVRYRLEGTGIAEEIPVPKVPQGETIKAGSIKFNAPDVEKRTEYKLVTELLKNGKIINRDMMKIHIYPKPQIAENSLAGKQILLYDIEGTTAELLDKAGVKYRRYEAGKTNLDSSIDLVIVGYRSADMDLEDDWKRIDEYVISGGRVLIFEQPSTNRLSRSIAFISAPGHPVFKGLPQDRFYLWKGKKGHTEVIKSATLLPLKGSHRSLVTVGGKGHLGIGNMTSSDIFSALIEKMRGRGIILTCNLEVSLRYGIDPESTILVNNMIEYLAALPERNLKRVGYIGRDGENILKDIKGYYKDIKIEEIGGYDVIVIGEGEVKEGSTILSNKDKINEYVRGGGTVVCLSQDPDTWTDKWLPEKIELKDFSKITRGLPAPHELTYGIRRVLFDPKKRSGDGNIFNNHFVFQPGSKWRKVIESCVIKEGKGARSVHEPSGGAMVAELKEGKGRYILCQIPYDKKQNQWINEAVVQLMSNIGVPREGIAREKLQQVIPKARPAEEKDWKGYFAVELWKYCNMLFKDEVAGDRKGGWTDQGDNDMRNLPVGDLILNGKPFRIIDPEATYHMEKHRSCIVLRDAKYRPYFPKEVKGIVVDKKAKELIFLHAEGWGVPVKDDEVVGRYVITYADGTKAEVPLRHNKDIGSWWPTGFQDSKTVRGDLAWIGRNSQAQVGLYKFSWQNPHPDKTIKTVDIETYEKRMIILVAITGKD